MSKWPKRLHTAKKIIELAIEMTDKTPEDAIIQKITDFQNYILSTANEKHSDHAAFNNESARDVIMDELEELLDAENFSRMDAARISALFYYLLLTTDE
jgi:hypothetical protein